MYTVALSDYNRHMTNRQTDQQELHNKESAVAESAFREIYTRLSHLGVEVAPRGYKVLECEDFSFLLPKYVRFANFQVRKLNLDYIKAEFLWYLNGDPGNTRIGKYASTWNPLINPDGTINSNYGQYIFGQQDQFAITRQTLRDDKDSRRASIVILSQAHLASDTKDVPCTYSINFRIRDNKLNMSIRMRSQDAIFGFGNDTPCFSLVHEMMYMSLKADYPDLEHGSYHHTADSFHVYERHFAMFHAITAGGLSKAKYEHIAIPKISSHAEVEFLRTGDFSHIPDEYEFSKWLTFFENEKYKDALADLGKPTNMTLF